MSNPGNQEAVYRLAHILKDLVGGDSPVHKPGTEDQCPICQAAAGVVGNQPKEQG